MNTEGQLSAQLNQNFPGEPLSKHSGFYDMFVNEIKYSLSSETQGLCISTSAEIQTIRIGLMTRSNVKSTAPEKISEHYVTISSQYPPDDVASFADMVELKNGDFVLAFCPDDVNEGDAISIGVYRAREILRMVDDAIAFLLTMKPPTAAKHSLH